MGIPPPAPVFWPWAPGLKVLFGEELLNCGSPSDKGMRAFCKTVCKAACCAAVRVMVTTVLGGHNTLGRLKNSPDMILPLILTL
jgi:hypothetical protein